MATETDDDQKQSQSPYGDREVYAADDKPGVVYDEGKNPVSNVAGGTGSSGATSSTGGTARYGSLNGTSTCFSSSKSMSSTGGGSRQPDSSANRQDIAERENAPDSGPSTALEADEQSFMNRVAASEQKGRVGKGYRKESGGAISQLRGRLSKFSRRRIAITAIACLLGGGGIFGTSILQGPLGVIHFSEQLQDSFSQREDEDNSRMVKVGRYIYHTKRGGGAQNVRMGYLGNKYADKIESKMNRAGIESAYTERSGYRTGYIIDPDKITGTDLDKYKKLDPKGQIDIDETQKSIVGALEEKFSARITVTDDGKLFMEGKDGKYLQAKALDKTIMKYSGYGKATTNVGAHVMGSRAGISWSPIKQFDRKINLSAEARYNAWKEDRAAKVKGGDAAPRGGAKNGVSDDTNVSEDENKARQQDGDQAAKTGNEVVAEATEASKDRSNIEKFQNSTRAKITAGTAGAIGVACIIKAADDSADDVKEKEVILPAMRIAGDFIAVGGHAKDGNAMNMEEFSFFAKQLYGKDSSGKETSWTESSAQRAKYGKKGGEEPSDTLKTIPNGSPFAFINAGSLGTLTGAACSTAGIIATTIVGVVTGGVAAAASGALVSAIALPHIMSQLTDWISGNALNPLPVGAELGSTGHFGSVLMARYQGVSAGGRELSPEESKQYAQVLENDKREEMQSKSLAYRLFNLEDSRTLASKTLDSGKFSSSSVASFVSNPVHTFSTLSSQMGSWASPSALADTEKPTDVIRDVGMSLDELNNPLVENPFKNAEDVVQSILPLHADYIERAKVCYGVEVDEKSFDITSFDIGSPTFKDAERPECKDTSDTYLQFRMYIKDSQLMTSVACYEGDDPSCSDLGFGSPETESSSEVTDTAGTKIDVKELKKPSDNIECAANTTDAGIIDGYTGGEKLRIRLCEIPNLPQASGYGAKNGHATVNARVSGAVYAMIEAAKKDGVEMSAISTSRTMADQEALCPCDGITKARPGFSNHQLGVAIDFGKSGTFMNKSNPMWIWLDKNADKFGYEPYTVEDWHWSPFGS